MASPRLFTIGHSTRPLQELVDMLRANGVQHLVDVRTVPKSRTNPQFNKEALEQQLPAEHGLTYTWMGKELGGLRKRDKNSDANAGWDNASFRGYADYMQSQAFEDGLDKLAQLVGALPDGAAAAIMCAEVVSFRCHRSLVSDALTARGWQVRHITSPGRAAAPHKLTSFAVVVQPADGDGRPRITYPAYEHTPKASGRRRRSEEGGGGSSSGRASKRSSSSAGSK